MLKKMFIKLSLSITWSRNVSMHCVLLYRYRVGWFSRVVQL